METWAKVVYFFLFLAIIGLVVGLIYVLITSRNNGPVALPPAPPSGTPPTISPPTTSPPSGTPPQSTPPSGTPPRSVPPSPTPVADICPIGKCSRPNGNTPCTFFSGEGYHCNVRDNDVFEYNGSWYIIARDTSDTNVCKPLPGTINPPDVHCSLGSAGYGFSYPSGSPLNYYTYIPP